MVYHTINNVILAKVNFVVVFFGRFTLLFFF